MEFLCSRYFLVRENIPTLLHSFCSLKNASSSLLPYESECDLSIQQLVVAFSSTEQLFWSGGGYLRLVAIALLTSLPGDFYFNLCHWGKQLVLPSVPWQFRFLFHTLLLLFSHFCLLWLAVVINQCLVNLPSILSQGSPSCLLIVWSIFFILTEMVTVCMQNDSPSFQYEGKSEWRN